MENNPNPTPNVTPPPAPEPAPEAPLAPEPQAPEAPAPAPEPIPEPAPAVTPEPTPAVTPEPAPAQPVAEPTPEPSPSEPAPINPFNPAATVAPADTAAPQPKKKLSGAIIGLIIGLAVLLIGSGVFAFLYFTSHEPNKLVASAVAKYLNQPTTNFSVSSEMTFGEQSLDYSVDAYVPDQNAAYIRVNGFQNIFSLFGDFISSFTDQTVESPFSAIDGVWWKVEPGSENATTFSGLVGGDFAAPQQKLAAIYQKHPFFKAEAAQGKYATSGDAFAIKIDEAALEAFQNEAGEDATMSFGPVSISKDLNLSSFVFTIKSTLLGDATLTGIYTETNDEELSSSSKTSINFEKDLSSAVSEAKDVSELQKLLEDLYENDDTSSEAAQRDTQRRNDYAALASSVVLYMTNNSGQLPAVGKLDATQFINATGTDPKGNAYTLELVDYAAEYDMEWSVGSSETSVYVVWHATCDSDLELTDAEGDRVFAIAGSLESGSYYCLASD